MIVKDPETYESFAINFFLRASSNVLVAQMSKKIAWKKISHRMGNRDGTSLDLGSMAQDEYKAYDHW